MKGEGKKPKFGECVRARERGESFTRSVHPRSEKAGTFFDLAGRNTRESGSLFSFSLVVFRASIERSSRGSGSLGGNRRAIWEWLCALAHGMRVQRAQHAEEKTQCTAPLRSVARCPEAVRSFLCFLSTPERKPPCSSSGYENL